MITAILKSDSSGNYSGFEVKGHSGSAPRGKDIVCAAVSAIVQAALIGLDEVADVKDTYTVSDGYIKCTLPKNLCEDKAVRVQTIVKTMHLGVLSIAEQYQDFVRIKED